MNWYIAKVAFNIVSGSGDHTPQFDEQYRLIKGESMEEAYLKAEHIGLNEEEVMLNQKNELVKWDFVGVSELYPVNELRDGMELFSSVNEIDDRASYIEMIKMKAAYVQSKFETVSENA
ncbi:MAG: DUF4288 domain-containing protein [Cyclobacteriaceae bacterium]